MRSIKKDASCHSEDRRTFLQKAGLGAMALSLPSLNIPSLLKDLPMGIVVHSYASRWHSKHESKKYPGFYDAIQLLEHCHELGGGGVQVGVHDWTSEFSEKIRDQAEQLGLYLEGSIGLPKNPHEVAAFEQEVKTVKEAGVRVLRTVCLSGRRYENFPTLENFKNFKKQSVQSLQWAEPIVRKHKIRLAVENHKDWRADELVSLLKQIDSEWLGVTLDFGNSISLLEDPMEVVQRLAPYVFTTHVKDMGVREYEDGFLLSEVPLGQGILDLPKMISLCRQHNPQVTFNLEMITRDPLEVPCLTEEYWATFEGISGSELARTLRMVRHKKYPSELPSVTQLLPEERLAVEEKNVVTSLSYSKNHLEHA
ncbi:sugar phosphate isomerase/epimerase [Catalinimonas alkaloidigena]|uniref:sugar phosphate isomerase/epimerase family protein n=1 Tax=Catalinimonas alkaloidigena TaxID=1075417 RepID=UPI0024050B19|nr:TIM barrel protein [Catalinimonas alkaloidigena]MDF9794882.1 sugar phosphate isomerase/epimerase [Catalinimonas alkaloidigena]